ncbi:MAG: hypothetical protein V4673_14375 [Pseudomonadota bacterium]
MPLVTHLIAVGIGFAMAGGIIWYGRRRERDIPKFLPSRESAPEPYNYGWMP